MLNTMCHPFEFWVRKIEECRPMCFTRYGDGELNAAFWVSRRLGGGRTKNGDNHTLRNKKLRHLMRRSIIQPGTEPNYYRSLWMDADCQPMERLARDHLERITPPGVIWYNALAIQAKCNAGQGFPYFKAMRNLSLPLVMIGPKHLRSLPDAGVFDYDGFVQVPYHKAFFAKDRIIEEALELAKGPTFFSIHAGPPSPIFSWILWKKRPDCVVFDLGSILDGMVHKRYGGPLETRAAITRKHWKKRATIDIVKRNLGRKK